MVLVEGTGEGVHDVTGVDNWVGGSTSKNKPGIHFAMGWDRAKNTGGIVFNTTVPPGARR